MSNVPSSAILMVCGIVAAALLVTFAFYSIQSNSDAKANADQKADAVNTSMLEDKYTQYDGEVLRGADVISAIQSFSGDEISVKVVQDDASVFYVKNYDEGSYQLSSLPTDTATLLVNAKTKGNAAYINPTRKYVGSIVRNPNNNAIMQVIFNATGAGGSNDGDPTGDNSHTSQPTNSRIYITYDPNGGSGGSVIQTADRNTVNTLYSSKPTRTGYNFIGWSESSTATSASYYAGGTIPASKCTGNITLYAVWSSKTYTLAFKTDTQTTWNPSGYSSSSDGSTVTYTKSMNYSDGQTRIPSEIPTKPGMTFKGWSTTQGGSVKYSAGATIDSTENATLYPVWDTTLTVEYQANGGSGNMALDFDSTNKNVQGFKDATSFTLAECRFTPPSGMMFDHWERTNKLGGTTTYADQAIVTFSVQYDLSTTEINNKRVVLKAIWREDPSKKLYDIKYDIGDATWKNGGNSNKYDKTGVQYLTRYTLPTEEPVRPGYDFAGWLISGNTYPAGGEFSVTKELTITAQWTNQAYKYWVENHIQTNEGGATPVYADTSDTDHTKKFVVEADTQTIAIKAYDSGAGLLDDEDETNSGYLKGYILDYAEYGNSSTKYSADQFKNNLLVDSSNNQIRMSLISGSDDAILQNNIQRFYYKKFPYTITIDNDGSSSTVYYKITDSDGNTRVSETEVGDGEQKITVYIGDKVTLIAKPDDGYEWEGWQTDSKIETGKKDDDGRYTITVNIDKSNKNLPDAEDNETDSDGTATSFETYTPVTKAESYTINYSYSFDDTNGHSYTSIDDVSFPKDEFPQKYTAESGDKDGILEIPSITKYGYVFVGWTGSNGSTPMDTVQIDCTAINDENYNGDIYGGRNLSFTAHFVPVEVTIQYHSNNGSDTVTTKSVRYSERFSAYFEASTLYSKSGSTFVNWNHSSDGTGVYYDAKAVMSTAFIFGSESKVQNIFDRAILEGAVNPVTYTTYKSTNGQMVTNTITKHYVSNDGKSYALYAQWSGDTKASIVEPSWTDTAVNPGDEKDKNPQLVSNVSWTSWAFIKATFPATVINGTNTDIITPVNVSSSFTVVNDYYDTTTPTRPQHVIVYAYTTPLAGYATTPAVFTKIKSNASVVSQISDLYKQDLRVNIQGVMIGKGPDYQTYTAAAKLVR